MSPTLNYYEEDSDEFIQNTLDKDMRQQYALFERYLSTPSYILDAGCGSGRDSLYFTSKGHRITAFDASKKMCDFASKLLSQEVLALRFEELEFQNEFDAIWASASLLHISKEQMPTVLKLLSRALKERGILYASFKYGDKEFIKDRRFFNSYTEESFFKLVESSSFQIRESLLLEDTRPEKKGEYWLNLILAVDKG